MHEFGLVGRRHHRHVRQAGEIGEVERRRHGSGRRRRRARRGRWRSAPAGSGSRRRGRPGRRRAAGRSNRSRRTACIPSAARPAAKVTACCSAMPTSKVRSGKRFREQVEAGARRHGGGDRDDLVVALGLRDQRVGEDPGVGGRVGLRLGLRAGDDVEFGDAVIFVGRRLGRRVALALLGHDMDQHRAAMRCRGRSSAPATDDRDYGRRSGRHSRSPALRTACRPSQCRGAYSSVRLRLVVEACGKRRASCLATSRSER